MHEREWLAERFEQNRGHLRGVAYRMLGSLSEADDAVQEAWLRLSRSNADEIKNLGGWLTTVVARVCLDMLRSRQARREKALTSEVPKPAVGGQATQDPEQEALLADSVGLALLVVLDRLSPAERLAFVLHDMFAVPFEDIASIVGRSLEATRQLASRARRRVQGGAEAVSGSDLSSQRKVVDAFLAAMRAGDFERLIAVLDPDLLVRVDEAAARPGAAREIRGARAWAQGALTFAHAIPATKPALVDGAVGLVWAPSGHLFRALRLTVTGDKITQVDIIGDPKKLAELDLAVLSD
jgi:RNA polymerase sigma factor (sigma-70 family)